MKYMRRILVMSLSILLLLAACGKKDDETLSKTKEENLKNLTESGMPIVDEPITLNFFARQSAITNDNWNDVMIFNEYKDMTNINVKWEMVHDSALSEKLNLTLASNNLPDAFHSTFMAPNDIMKHGEQGLFIPLNDLIDEHAPNFKKLLEENPEIETAITFPDGNIYGFPMLADPDFLSYHVKEIPWINEKWLEALGLDMPETTEEFYEYLKAVKTKDPNGNGEADEIPYGARDINSLYRYLLGSFGLATKGSTNQHIDLDPETEELRFYPIVDEYKELLQYMNKLFSEELIEQNIFSIEDEQYRANAAEGRYGSTVFFAPEAAIGGDVDDLVGMPALEGPHGDKAFITFTSQVLNKSGFIITNDNEHPEATVRWVDHFYSEEGIKLFFMGIEGETFEVNDEGEAVYMDHILNSEEGNTVPQEQAKYLTFPGGGYPSVIKEEYFVGAAESAPSAIAAAKVLEPDIVKDPWPILVHTKEEADKLDAFGSDIEKYVGEMRDKFIAGQESFDNWDKYVKELDKMNLKEYMEIKQAALDRIR